MATKTDIVNKALTLVGAAPITSITEDTNNAAILRRVYDISLRSILSEGKWNFATKRALLTVSTDTMAWYDTGETYVYVRPTDIIRIYGANDRDAIYREEGDYIISDTVALGIRYVYYLDDPQKYSALFTDALIDKLCSDISFMIVNSSTLGEKFLNKYETISLPNAMAANAQSGVQQTIQDDAWELAKYSDTQVNS